MKLNVVYADFVSKYNKPFKYSFFASKILDRFFSYLQGYNYSKYWKRREYVVSGRGNFILKCYCFLWLKRVDAKNHCSFGTSINNGARFATPPILEHGPSGIIIGHDASIGSFCRIFQQVTIAQGNVVIGDNVLIGAGAKILPNVTVGNNVKIGANCVVVEDLPDNSTCVLQKPRIITNHKM